MPLVVPLLVAGISLGRPSPASAATVCNNPDTFAFQNTTIKDSLVVPAGGSCNVTNEGNTDAGGALEVSGNVVGGATGQCA